MGWLAGQLGWIRPGSGSARPDPACPAFLLFLFLCEIQLLNMCYVLNRFKIALSLRKL
jgi:hypothetical protein